MKSIILNFFVLFLSSSQLTEFGLWVDNIAYIFQTKTRCYIKTFYGRISFLKWLKMKVEISHIESKTQSKQISSLFLKKSFKHSAFYSPSIELRNVILKKLIINNYGTEFLPKSI